MDHFTAEEKKIIETLLDCLYEDVDGAIDLLVDGFHHEREDIDEMFSEQIFELARTEISGIEFAELESILGFIDIEGFDLEALKEQAKPMKQPCKNPCPSCPYVKKSAKGYFGGHDPKEYADAIHQDTVIACHTRTKHNEETQLPNSDNDITICTGHIVSQIKVFKSSIHPEGAKAQQAIREQDNFEQLKENALGFDFKEYHDIE